MVQARNRWAPGLEPTTDRVPEVEAVSFRVSCVPYDYINAQLYTVWVQKRATNKWCVTDGTHCFRADGSAEYESLPSNREDDFKARTRFSLDEALDLAKKVAPAMTMMGRGVDDIIEFEDGD